MIRQRYLVAGVSICIATAGVFGWETHLKRGNIRTEASGSARGLTADEWYMASPNSLSCLKSDGPDQKIQEIRNTGEDPTIDDDNRGTIKVMREGPPGEWTFFRTMELCNAHNEAVRNGSIGAGEVAGQKR